MQDTSTIDIDLSAIDHNMAVIRRVVGDACALCPIVKADAYGLGVSRVARRLVNAGAEMLAVYSMRQAMETAAAINGVTPVLVLMPVAELPRDDEITRMLLAGQLHLVVHDEVHLAKLNDCAARIGCVLPVHLEVDVGMSRGGAQPDEASRMLRTIAAAGADARYLSLRGIFSHFSHSRFDEVHTQRQHEAFEHVLNANRRFIPHGVFEHVSSTYSLARNARYHRSMVRFGLAWLGYGIDELEAPAPLITREELRPVVRWTSSIVQSKEIRAGASVGYGAQWCAQKPSTIALVPVGYADGFPAPRQPSMTDRQCVAIHAPDGRTVYAPVVGVVNMDQITIDVTGLNDCDASSWIGCEVELVSRNVAAPNHLPRVAAQSGLIVHEFLTRMNPRVGRTMSISISVAPEVVAPRPTTDAARLNSAAG